jgi:adenine-specific DNA-methyltransferase
LSKNQKIYIGDCRSVIKKLSDNSISSAITSPPYNIGKNYGKYKDKVSLDEWKELIKEVFILLKKKLKKNGSFFLNVSPVPNNKTKEIIPLDAICYFIGKETGFYLRNSIVWHFNNMQNCSNRLSGRWEKILWFVNDINNYIFNLDDVRIPYITKNDKRLDPDGGRNPTDVWYFDRVNNMTKKKLNIQDIPTMYPKPMIERIIRMSSNKGDTILDPFVGSGTTLLAAESLGRKGIGIDIDKKYKKVIQSRLKKETVSQLKLL